MNQATSLRAHAKLTFELRITGVRDDGYHLIDAEMASLDLHDVVTIDTGPDSPPGITVSGTYAAAVPTDRSNLVAGALERIGRTLDDTAVHITKQIPHGGGLGGGSTDAAAVLRWGGVGTVTERRADDLSDAASLGADISFCLVGGRARVTGIGELVEPLPHLDRTVTLVIPPLSVSTPAAYRAWDELGMPRVDGANDLEPAALLVEPGLAWWRDAIADRCGAAPMLAGSGATWFIEGARASALADLVDEGAEIVVASTIAAGVDNEGDAGVAAERSS